MKYTSVFVSNSLVLIVVMYLFSPLFLILSETSEISTHLTCVIYIHPQTDLFSLMLPFNSV